MDSRGREESIRWEPEMAIMANNGEKNVFLSKVL